MPNKVFLYGAGGHAKVILDILRDNGKEVVAIIDDNPNIKDIQGIPVIHEVKEEYNPFVISIGYNEVRKKIEEKLQKKYISGIHSSAIISPTANVGIGTVVMQGAIIQAEAKIANHCIVNTGASVGHECSVGDFAHIAPHSTLCGNVHVGEGTWIGAGSTIVPGISIGKWCIIAAGAVVIRDVPDYAVMAGVPAKMIRMKQ